MRAQRVVVHLADQELEEAVELVCVSAQTRRQSRGIDAFCRLERPHLDLQPVAEPLDAAEHADGVARGEPAVEQVDVVPDARPDPAARVHELEGEVARAASRSQSLLARDRVDALNRAVFLEFGDFGHRREFRMEG